MNFYSKPASLSLSCSPIIDENKIYTDDKIQKAWIGLMELYLLLPC